MTLKVHLTKGKNKRQTRLRTKNSESSFIRCSRFTFFSDNPTLSNKGIVGFLVNLQHAQFNFVSSLNFFLMIWVIVLFSPLNFWTSFMIYKVLAFIFLKHLAIHVLAQFLTVKHNFPLLFVNFLKKVWSKKSQSPAINGRPHFWFSTVEMLMTKSETLFSCAHNVSSSASPPITAPGMIVVNIDYHLGDFVFDASLPPSLLRGCPLRCFFLSSFSIFLTTLVQYICNICSARLSSFLFLFVWHLNEFMKRVL